MNIKGDTFFLRESIHHQFAVRCANTNLHTLQKYHEGCIMPATKFALTAINHFLFDHSLAMSLIDPAHSSLEFHVY